MVLELEPLSFGASLERLKRDEMRVGKRFADDESGTGFQYALEFSERLLLIRNFAENEDQIRGVETVVRVRQPPSIAAYRFDIPMALLPGPYLEVLDHRLLDVGSMNCPVRLDCPCDRPRVVARPRTELEDPFSGSWIEERAQLGASDLRSGEIDPDTLRVRTGSATHP